MKKYTEENHNTISQDTLLLEILKENSRTPFMRIAKELGVSEGTIRNRVYNLEKKGIIKRFTVELGNMATAIVTINVKTGINTREVANKIKKLGASRIFEVAGKTDIICFVKTRSLEETNEFIDQVRDIEGVFSTETIPVMREV